MAPTEVLNEPLLLIEVHHSCVLQGILELLENLIGVTIRFLEHRNYFTVKISRTLAISAEFSLFNQLNESTYG